jgi:hypothetical protein
MTARHPISPFGAVVVKGSFGMRHRQGIVCSGRSLTRMSSAGTPSTPASAARASAPGQTSGLDHWPGSPLRRYSFPAPSERTQWRSLANAVMSAPLGKTLPRVRAVLTRDILFGMNLLTLAGFVVMGLTLTLNRMGQAGKGLSLGLMAAGTVLVFLGLYAGGWSG